MESRLISPAFPFRKKLKGIVVRIEAELDVSSDEHERHVDDQGADQRLPSPR